MATWMPQPGGICTQLCRRLQTKDSEVLAVHGMFDTLYDLGEQLSQSTILRGDVASRHGHCLNSCGSFLVTSGVLMNLWLVFLVSAEVEWRARCAFLTSQDIRVTSSGTPFILTVLRHWAWWGVLFAWAVTIAY